MGQSDRGGSHQDGVTPNPPTARYSVTPVPRMAAMNACGRLCCKSPFAVVTKNSPGCRREFRVKMWGASSPDDKLTGDLGNVIEATESGDRQLIRVTAEKLSPDNFRLLQQYRHERDIGECPLFRPVMRAKRTSVVANLRWRWRIGCKVRFTAVHRIRNNP
jgi:hypothetical protein